MKLPQQIAQADELKKIPPITAEKPTGLCVTVTDADTGEPIEGIPVWCKQKDTEWDYNALTTNRLGQVTFYRMIHGIANYGVNKGGYHGYSEIPSKQCTIYTGMITHRKEKLTKTDANGDRDGNGDEDRDGDGGISKADIVYVGNSGPSVKRGESHTYKAIICNRGEKGGLHIEFGKADANKNPLSGVAKDTWRDVKSGDCRDKASTMVIPIDYPHDVIYIFAKGYGYDRDTRRATPDEIKYLKQVISDPIPQEGFAEVVTLDVEVESG